MVTTNNDYDIARISIPLLIRLLEFAREDAKTDLDLHFLAENIIKLHTKKAFLNMQDYNLLTTPEA
jgi:Holliday junction resolvasome RuvABC ATP-dependent DNA helicase subunit